MNFYGVDTGYYVATDVKPTTAPEHLSKFDPALWPFYCYVWLKGVGVQTEAVQEFFLLRQLGEDEARSADKLLGELFKKLDAEGRGAFKNISAAFHVSLKFLRQQRPMRGNLERLKALRQQRTEPEVNYERYGSSISPHGVSQCSGASEHSRGTHLASRQCGTKRSYWNALPPPPVGKRPRCS